MILFTSLTTCPSCGGLGYHRLRFDKSPCIDCRGRGKLQRHGEVPRVCVICGGTNYFDLTERQILCLSCGRPTSPAGVTEAMLYEA
jgi:DnaJ-class molecular chaperone